LGQIIARPSSARLPLTDESESDRHRDFKGGFFNTIRLKAVFSTPACE